MGDTFSGGTTTLNPGCGDRSRDWSWRQSWHRSIRQGPEGSRPGRFAAVGAMLFGGTLCATGTLHAGGEFLGTFTGGALGVQGNAYSSFNGPDFANDAAAMSPTNGGIGGGTSSGPVLASGSIAAEIDGDFTTTIVRFTGSGSASIGGDSGGYASVGFGTFATSEAETIRLLIAEDCFFSIVDAGDVSVSFVAEGGGSGSFFGDSLSAGVYLIDMSVFLNVDSSTPEDSFDLDWTLTLTTVPTPGAIAMLVPGLLGMAAGSRRRRS